MKFEVLDRNARIARVEHGPKGIQGSANGLERPRRGEIVFQGNIGARRLYYGT